MNQKQQERRAFFTLGIPVGAAIGTFLYKGVSGIKETLFPDKIKQFENQYNAFKKSIKPGISINGTLKINNDGKNENTSSSFSENIILDNINTKMNFSSIINSKDSNEWKEFVENSEIENIFQIVNFTNAIKGPYTSVHLVGSSAKDRSDKGKGDLDILVLNGGKIQYNQIGQLYKNQEKRVLNHFRCLSLPEIYESILPMMKEYDKKGAKKLERKIESLHPYSIDQLETSFYIIKKHSLYSHFSKKKFKKAPEIWPQSWYPKKDYPDFTNSKPIHLLTPESAKKESITYNVAKLKEALYEKRAITLYKGKEQKLL